MMSKKETEGFIEMIKNYDDQERQLCIDALPMEALIAGVYRRYKELDHKMSVISTVVED